MQVKEDIDKNPALKQAMKEFQEATAKEVEKVREDVHIIDFDNNISGFSVDTSCCAFYWVNLQDKWMSLLLCNHM